MGRGAGRHPRVSSGRRNVHRLTLKKCRRWWRCPMHCRLAPALVLCRVSTQASHALGRRILRFSCCSRDAPGWNGINSRRSPTFTEGPRAARGSLRRSPCARAKSSRYGPLLWTFHSAEAAFEATEPPSSLALNPRTSSAIPTCRYGPGFRHRTGRYSASQALPWARWRSRRAVRPAPRSAQSVHPLP